MADIRILLNDKAISDLESPSSEQYRARDAQLKGFHVVVGRRRKVFAVQGDLREGGKRIATISVRIGNAATMSTREARATAKTYVAQISKGRAPNPKPAETDQQAGEASPANRDRTQPAGLAAAHRRVTLKEAWERYRDAHLIRKGRSEGTIEGYRDHVERLLEIGSTRPCRNWLTIPARSSRGTMRLPRSMVPISPMAPCGRCGLSIIMRAKRHRYLPADNPASVVD